MRAHGPLAVLALCAIVAATGCAGMPEDSCIARGTKTLVHGSLSTTLVLSGDAPAVNSSQETLTISDYTRSCTYDQEEFPVEVLGCRVFVRLQPLDEHEGDDPVPAVIVGGQVCTLALPQGPARLSIGSGGLAFPGGVPTFTLEGGVGAIGGVSALGSINLVMVSE